MCNFRHINVRGKIKTAHTPLSDQLDLFLEIHVISVLCVCVTLLSVRSCLPKSLPHLFHLSLMNLSETPSHLFNSKPHYKWNIHGDSCFIIYTNVSKIFMHDAQCFHQLTLQTPQGSATHTNKLSKHAEALSLSRASSISGLTLGTQNICPCAHQNFNHNTQHQLWVIHDTHQFITRHVNLWLQVTVVSYEILWTPVLTHTFRGRALPQMSTAY